MGRQLFSQDRIKMPYKCDTLNANDQNSFECRAALREAGGGVTSRDEFVTWQTNKRKEERKKETANKNENGQLTFICIFKFLDIARGNFCCFCWSFLFFYRQRHLNLATFFTFCVYVCVCVKAHDNLLGTFLISVQLISFRFALVWVWFGLVGLLPSALRALHTTHFPLE